MANEENKKSGGIKPDEIIDRLVTDPDNPNVKRVVGLFLGKSSREKYWRLYLNSTLSNYLEFRQEDTLEAQRQPSGGIVVWLKPEAKVQQMVTEPVPEEFLKGELLGGNLRRASASGIGGLRRNLGLAAAGCGGGTQDASCQTVGSSCGPACSTTGYTCDYGYTCTFLCP